MKELWEILVPMEMPSRFHPNKVSEVFIDHHREWDDKVRAISGGLTIYKPAKGQWISPLTDKVHKERMIPVRIACSRVQIEEIMSITLKHYRQEEVMAYRVSDEVLFRKADENE